MDGPRERYAMVGPGQFGDVELLALVLGTGVGGRSVRGIAAGLIDAFGDLDGMASAEVAALCAVPGVGPARAVRLHAALQLGRRSLGARWRGTPVHCAEDAFDALGAGLAGLDSEELHGLYLDRRHQPLGLRRLTVGSDSFTVVDPRQVFRPAIALGASAVVLAHNHPSGDPTPSEMDREVTRRVAAAGAVLGVRVLDHLVVADGGFASLAERGELPPSAAVGAAWLA